VAHDIVSAFIFGLRQKDILIIRSAAEAAFTGLTFCFTYLETNPINQAQFVSTVLDALQATPDEETQLGCLSIMIDVCSLNYSALRDGMQTIYQVTMKAITEAPDEFIKLAIEFWQAVGEQETKLLDEIAYAEENELPPPSTQNQDYIKGISSQLVPLLLEALTKVDGDANPDDWTVSEAAQNCLIMISTTLEDAVLPLVVPFVTSHITAQKWKHREAALLALGAILEGPDPKEMEQFILSVTPIVMTSLKSEQVVTRETSAWTLGEICKYHFGSISKFAPPILEALLGSIGDEPRVAVHVCYALHILAASAQFQDRENPFIKNFEPISKTLFAACDRKDAEKENLKAAGYKALEQIIATVPQETNTTLEQLIAIVFERISAVVAMSPISIEELMIKNEATKHHLSLLQVLVERLRESLPTYSDNVMALALTIIQSKVDSTVHEEAIMLVGGVANVLDEAFLRYSDTVMPMLLTLIQNWKAASTYSVALNCVTDVIQALADKFFPYGDTTMGILLTNLQSPEFPATLKPAVLSLFGDLAMGLGDQFVRYLPIVFEVLSVATQSVLQVTAAQDYDVLESMNLLRQAVCDAYQGIIQGPCENDASLITPHIPLVMALVAHVAQDNTRTENVACAVIGIIGDLIGLFGNDMHRFATQPFIYPFLKKTKKHAENQMTVDTVEVTMGKIDELGN